MSEEEASEQARSRRWVVAHERPWEWPCSLAWPQWFCSTAKSALQALFCLICIFSFWLPCCLPRYMPLPSINCLKASEATAFSAGPLLALLIAPAIALTKGSFICGGL
jgi:hypothetical protein